MTTQVEELVLLDNHDQNLAITVAQKTPVLNIENFGQLIRDLEQEGLLNREVEFLPTMSEISRRTVTKERLTRPELSVLLSYSKMLVEKQLINIFLMLHQKTIAAPGLPRFCCKSIASSINYKFF